MTKDINLGRSKNNNFFNLKDYQVIPEASRISYFNKS